MEDKQLDSYIKNFKKTGENIFFENIYRFFYPKILRFTALNVSDVQAAEEISSEVFVKVYRYLRKLNLNAPAFKAWLYKIARNLIIDFYRREARTVKKVSLEQYLEEKLIQQDINDTKTDRSLVFENDEYFLLEGFDSANIKDKDFLNKLNSLGELQKQVLLLRFVEEMDYKSIGRVINKDERAVRLIKFRAVSKLREMVK
jgi:RNA polymerase sigma-70 factor (ECF subfamily)